VSDFVEPTQQGNSILKLRSAFISRGMSGVTLKYLLALLHSVANLDDCTSKLLSCQSGYVVLIYTYMYKISKLLALGRRIFHAQDLAVLWGISNKTTLYVTINRLVKKGVLFSIYKGLYATVPIEKLSNEELGQAIIHRFAYVSTETILFEKGVINQVVYPMTWVTDRSKKVTVAGRYFVFRQMSPERLYNPVGIVAENGVYRATAERAVADMQYFNPKYYFDSPL
jgi:predicted transcriptional regulator of viral defense system